MWCDSAVLSTLLGRQASFAAGTPTSKIISSHGPRSPEVLVGGDVYRWLANSAAESFTRYVHGTLSMDRGRTPPYTAIYRFGDIINIVL